MAYLMDFSTEIILIVSHLPAADKASILRVCKRFQQIAEPMLYADINLKLRLPEDVISVRILLASIMDDTSKALYVKRLQSVGKSYGAPSWIPNQSRLSHQDSKAVSSIARKAAPPGEREVWARSAEYGNSDLLQTLVISQLPNLTHLTIGGDLYLSSMLRHRLCWEEVIDGFSRFQHVKRVDLSGFRVFDLLPFFYLPSIQDLRIVIPPDRGTFVWPAKRPCARSLTSLSLKRSGPHTALLGEILSVTPNLKCLEYQFAFSPRYWHGTHNLWVNCLGKALTRVKITLE